VAKVEPFERHARAYDGWFDRNEMAYRSEVGAIRRQLPAYGNALEIGVGTARFAALLGVAYGVEPSKKMAAVARERGVGVVVAVAERLPFRDASFDHALMVTTICFVDDIGTSFREAHRVLRPGGLFVLGFVDSESFLGREYQQRKNESVFYRHATFYSPREVIVHLEQAGFSDIRSNQTLFRAPSAIEHVEPTRPGYGEGAFVTIRGTK
jgi:SAM-dependent methyltransferase